MGRSKGRAWTIARKLAPWLYFIALTLFMTLPLIQHAGDHIFGNRGDNFYFLWLIRWWEGAVQRLPASPIVVPGLNYPEGWNLAYNEIPLTMVIPALPVSAVFGTTAGFNFSVWLSFILSGMGTYFFARKLNLPRGAALLAGTIFAFAPYRFGHLMGHFNLIGTQWIPFYFMALHGALEKFALKEHSGRAIAGAAVFLGLIGLTSQYYLYMTLVLTATFVAGFFFWSAGRESRKRASFYLRLLIMGAVLAGVAAVCVFPYLSLSRHASIPPRAAAEMAFWSPSLADFVIPSPQHFLFRGWVNRHFDRRLWVENNLYLGFIPLGLAVLAFAVRRRIPESRRKIILFAFVFLCAFVLALGTQLKVTPGPTDPSKSLVFAEPGIPLPGALLVRVLPFYNRMRVFSRFAIFAVLFLSLLAGYGALFTVGRIKNKKTAAVMAAAFLALVVFEFKNTGLPIVKVEGRPVDRWLAGQHERGAVIQFPADEIGKAEQIFYSTIHRKPFVGSFSAAFFSPQYLRTFPCLERFPDRDSVALLKELKVRFILVDSTLYSDFSRIQFEIGRLGLRFLRREGDIFVYTRADL